MTKVSGRLERWTDFVLGDFTRASGVWNGTCEFNGRTVRLLLDADNTDPTREEQLAVFEPSRPIRARLREAEPEFRCRVATQIVEAVVS
jgi:hypothetical protein